jgi:hypothetical protein
VNIPFLICAPFSQQLWREGHNVTLITISLRGIASEFDDLRRPEPAKIFGGARENSWWECCGVASRGMTALTNLKSGVLFGVGRLLIKREE